MDEMYNIDPSIPNLTEKESQWLKRNVRYDYLVMTMMSEEMKITCGGEVPVYLEDDEQDVEYDILISDKDVEKVRRCPKYLLFLNIMRVTPGLPGHQNAMFIDSTAKKVFWIEPQFSEEIKSFTDRVRQHVVGLMKRLKIEDYTLVVPEDTCIQIVAEDKNCVFWSIILFELIVYGQATDTNDATKKILKMYPTKEKLRDFIENIKSRMYRAIRGKTNSFGGKKRLSSWGPYTENLNLHRRTRRYRQLYKTKSRYSRNAKRTQKHKSRHSK